MILVHVPRCLAIVLLAVAITACATPQTDLLRQQPGNLPPAAEIADAPFFAQKTRECGPAALAMVLRASGLDVTPEVLTSQLMTPARGGTLSNDIIAAARRHGHLAYPATSLHEVLREVAGGRPVVVLQNLGLSWAPQWHYAVMIGYDLQEGTVTLHSGSTAGLVTDIRTFERTWARGDHWALLVLKPGQLPLQADKTAYRNAVLGLEQAQKASAAMAAYKAGLTLWPDDLVLMIGLGNAHYRLGQKDHAKQVFAQATTTHPGSAEAFNNLAHVLLEQGDISAAEKAARRAVEIGGRNADTYRKTLTAAIDQGRRSSF